MIFWTVADTHLGHGRLVEPEYGGRPVGFEELILKNLRDLVKPGDVFIHLGDVSLYKDEYWQAQLMKSLPTESNRWLIRGNHDTKSQTWYLDHGWNWIADQMTMRVFGKRILLSHKPVQDSPEFDLNIHGHHHHPKHHHPEDPQGTKQRLSYLEKEHQYMPINLRQLVEIKGRHL